LEPLTKSRTPSKAFCFLYKFCQLELTVNYLEELLNSKIPLMKGLGLLWVRHMVPPKELFHWYKHVLHIQTRIQANNDGQSETVSAFAIRLLRDLKYYGHALPKIPVPVHRLYRKKLLGIKIQEKRNRRYQSILKPGEDVMAMYHEDTEFYAATIERYNNKSGNYFVHFSDYDEKQECSLGQIKIPRELRKAYLRRRSDDSHRSPRGEEGRRAGDSQRSLRDSHRSKRRRSRSRSRGDHRSRKRRRRSRERYHSRDRHRSRDRNHSRSPRNYSRSPSRSPDLDKLIREEDSKAQCVDNAKNCAKGVMGYKMALCNSSGVGSGRLFDQDAFTKAPLVVNMSKNKEIYGPSRQRQKEIKAAKTRAMRQIPKPVKVQSKEYQSKMQKLYAKYGNAASNGKKRRT